MLKPPQVRRSTPTWTACLAIIFLGFWQADLASASSPAIKYLQSVLSAHAEKLSDERLPNEPEQQHPTDPARPLRVPQLSTDLAMLKARGALVYHSAAPTRGGTAYDLYAAFDPATHRLLILEKHFAWEVSSLTSAPVPPYKLATMPLSHISTDMGFSIGSAEGSIIRRLGNGLIRRRGDQTIRIYDSDTGCETSTFAFRRHSVVGVWSLTGGC